MQLPSSLATRLQYQHKSLVDLIDGLTEDHLRRQPNPGKWSVFEHIVHLQTYQHAFIERVRTLLEGDNPSFDRYSAESDPLFLDNCQRSFREIMQDYLEMRKEIVAGILTLPESDYAKTAVHPLYGKQTLPQWLNFFLLHESHHLFTIFKISATWKKELAEV